VTIIIKSLRRLTRSVVVICLSQYLQHLIWTVKEMLKNHKHLIPFIIITRSRNQPHPTLQILRHTGLLPGQLHANKLDNQPDSCAGNTNYSNCRAVIGHFSHQIFDLDHLDTLTTYQDISRIFHQYAD